MASVFVKDGRLMLQMRIREVQLREALHLRDTAANRKCAEGECAMIERELVMRTFDYWSHFPQSRSGKAKAMFPRRAHPEDVTVETWLQRWLEYMKPRRGFVTAYDIETMVNRHIVPNLGTRVISELCMEDVGNFVGVLRQCRGIHGRFMGP